MTPIPNIDPEALQGLYLQTLQVLDIWWVPNEHVSELKPATDAFCLVAAIERTPTGSPAVVHVVAGSRNRSTRATVVVEPPETELAETTYFRFWRSKGLAPTTILESGKWRGRLSPGREVDVERAIRESNLVVLKRLLAA